MTSSTDTPQADTPQKDIVAAPPILPVESTPQEATSGSGLAVLALILALAAIAQPWVLARYSQREALRAFATNTAAITIPRADLPIPQAANETAPALAPATPDTQTPLPSVPQNTAPPPAISGDEAIATLQMKLSSLMTELSAQSAAIAQLRSGQQAIPGMTMLRLFIATQQLRITALSGQPFSRPLAVAQSLLAKTNATEQDRASILNALSPYAAEGLPTLDRIAAVYNEKLPDLIRGMRVGEAASPWDRILAEIKNTVLIRQKNGMAPDTTDASGENIAAQISTKLDERNLAAARDLASRLPPDAQVVLGAWKTDVNALLDAEQALDKLDALVLDETDQPQP